MRADLAVDLVKSLAWPFVGLLTLIYIWRSDAIGRLLKISASVDELRDKLSELVRSEERLRATTSSIGESISILDQFRDDLILMKANIENIQDKIDQRDDAASSDETSSRSGQTSPTELFSQLDLAWSNLTEALQLKFDWIDRRKIGSEAYRFAHGNRKGAKLTYEQADEIARLHSTIKSFRRRQSTVSEWLDQTTCDEFITKCRIITDEIRKV